jgi:hypothetical protein
LKHLSEIPVAENPGDVVFWQKGRVDCGQRSKFDYTSGGSGETVYLFTEVKQQCPD